MHAYIHTQVHTYNTYIHICVYTYVYIQAVVHDFLGSPRFRRCLSGAGRGPGGVAPAVETGRDLIEANDAPEKNRSNCHVPRQPWRGNLLQTMAGKFESLGGPARVFRGTANYGHGGYLEVKG